MSFVASVALDEKNASRQMPGEETRLKEFPLVSDKKFGLLAAGFAASMTVRAKNMFAQRLIRGWHLLVASGEYTEHGWEIQEPVFLGGEIGDFLLRDESCGTGIGLQG